MWTRRIAIVLATSICGCAGGDKPTAPPATASVAIALSAPSATIARGASQTTIISLTRGGGYSGAVTLAAEGLPANVTATFAPASLLGSTLTSTLTLSVGPTAPVGFASVTIRASGTGVTADTEPYNLTVQRAPLVIQPGGAAFSVSRGGRATVSLAIVRFNYPGAVDLSVEGLPSGLTASFTPNALTDTLSVLTLSAAAGATLGTAVVTVRGTGMDGATATAPISLTVAVAGSGGSVAWRWCDVSSLPAWFAYRSGTTGPFTRVTVGANATYTFTLTADVGTVAYVQTTNGYPAGFINFATISELVTIGQEACYSAPTRKSLTANVAGLSVSQAVRIRVGGGGADVSFPATSTPVDFVTDGVTDLLASRSIPDSGDPSRLPDRFIVRRSVNYPAGSTIPLLDFAGSEAFAPATATLTIANADGGDLTVGASFATARGVVGALEYPQNMLTSSTSYPRFGVPTAQLQAGDYHVITVLRGGGIAGDDYRSAAQYNREFVDRIVTLGPMLEQPALSTLATAPYARLRAAGTWQSEYDGELEVVYEQTTGALKYWTIVGTRAYSGVGTSTYEFDIPDFSAVDGFNVSWGLSAGVQTDVAPVGRSLPVLAFSESAAFLTATRRRQVVTP